MISEEFKNYRQRIIDCLKLLSSTEEQISYQASVNVNVPDELLCMWFDDLSMPGSLKHVSAEALTTSEVAAIERFSEKIDKAGVLIRRPNEITLEELLRNQAWKNVIAEASSLLQELNKNSTVNRS